MYAIICIRTNIAHPIGIVRRVLSNLGREHWNVIKWKMRYFYGTSSMSLSFCTAKPILYGYTNSYMTGDIDTLKFAANYLITLAGGVVSWQSRL